MRQHEKTKGYEMTNLIKANETLTKMTANIKLAQDKRYERVQAVINETLSFYKANKEVFSTKKNAVSVFLKTVYADKAIDAYTKRAVKIAKAVLIDGYKIRKEVLSLAQMEQLTKFGIRTVNDLMAIDNDDEYCEAVKALIKCAKVEKVTRVFSASKAKSL